MKWIFYFSLCFASCRAIKPYVIPLPSGLIADTKLYQSSGEFFVKTEVWDSTYLVKYEINCGRGPGAYYVVSKDLIGLIKSVKNIRFIAVTDTIDGEFYQFGKKIENSKNVILVPNFSRITEDELELFKSLNPNITSHCPKYSLEKVIGFVINAKEL